MPSTTTQEKKNKFMFIRSHPLFYFQTIWDTVLSNCRSKYHCLRELAIDEAMIPYRGFKGWCQKLFMPKQPIHNGFKVYAMAESVSGYLCNFTIHVPTFTPRKMVDVAMEAASTHLDRFHHIFTDKFYTSRNLATQLLQRNTYLTGAIRTNSAQLPIDLSLNVKRNKTNLAAVQNIKKTPRGTFYARQCGQLIYTIWNDSSMLSVLCSAHSGFRTKPTDMVSRRFLKDGAKVRERQPVPAPPAVIDYCKSMGGVDLADQLKKLPFCKQKVTEMVDADSVFPHRYKSCQRLDMLQERPPKEATKDQKKAQPATTKISTCIFRF
jgi:hypothetical protein